MKTSFVVGIVVVVIVAAILIFTLRPAPTSNVVKNNPALAGSNSTSETLFSSSPYYSYAYLISGDNLSAQAKTALTGFDLTQVANSDGTITYTLTAHKQGYLNQTYTLSSGEKLYFIERSLGDDNAADNTDFFPVDDMAVVVNSQGYIVQ